MVKRSMMQPRTLGRCTRGFTLIEALAAMALIAVVLPVVMQGISVAIGLSSHARHQAEAATLAKMKLDELIATQQLDGSAPQGDFGEDFPGYEWTADINTWPSDANLSELTITVTWTARQRQQQVQVATLVNLEDASGS